MFEFEAVVEAMLAQRQAENPKNRLADRDRAAEREQSERIAQAMAEEQRVIETILKPAFLKAVKAANLKPWPQGFELKLYKVSYCTGSTFDDEGDADFDYAQLWSPTEPFDQSGVGTVSGWDVIGNRKTVVLYPHHTPTVEIITCRSYADIPSNANRSPLRGYAPVGFTDVGDRLFTTALKDGETGTRWDSDLIEDWVDGQLQLFGLPTREISQEILDLIPSYQDDGCGCWSCEHMEQDAQDKGYCGHAWSQQFTTVLDELSSNAVECPGFIPNDQYHHAINKDLV